MNNWTRARHITRLYCIIVLTIESVLMLYLTFYVYRHRKQKLTLFTALMVTTIGLSLAIGFTEAVIFLVATNDNNVNKIAVNFIFQGCGFGLGALASSQNYI